MSEEGAIHNYLDHKDKEKYDAYSRKHSFKYLLNHPHTDHNPQRNLPLDTSEAVVDEEDQKLQIGNKTNHNKHYHVDVPLETEVKQNLSMAEGREI